jgi:hypothetical protein
VRTADEVGIAGIQFKKQCDEDSGRR